MKKLKLTKLISSALLVALVLALNPIGVNAEWKQDNAGWWYSEGDSWVVGWKSIDGKWYYFYPDGYMANNVEIDGCYLDFNGVWIQNAGIGSDSNQNYKIAKKEISGSFEFNKSNGEITKYIGADTDVVIPNTIDGVNVTSIGDGAFYQCSNLVHVTIPASVTNIGSGAFKNCSSLTNLIIPDAVKK